MLWHLNKLQIPKEKLIEYFNEPNSSLPNLSHIAPFKDDMDVAVAAVSRKGTLLYEFSERIKNDKNLVQIAVTQDPCAVRSASQNLKSDIDIAKAVLQSTEAKTSGLLYVFDDSIKNNLNLLSSTLPCIQHASEEIRSNKTLMTKIINERSYEFKYSGESLFEDIEYCKNAIDKLPSNVSRLPKEHVLLKDRTVAIDVLSKDPNMLEFFTKFQDDAEVVKVAYIREQELLNDTSILYFVEEDVFQYSSKRIKDIVKDNNPEKALNSLALQDKLNQKLSIKQSSLTRTMKI